jgi:hypothetical protein
MPYTVMPNNPLRRCFAVTPSDATVYDPPVMMLRCGGAGNVTVTTLEAGDVLITGAFVGEQIPGPFSKIKATGTTATAMTAWLNE